MSVSFFSGVSEYEGRAPVDYATWLFFALPITLVGTVLIFLLVVPVFFRCRRWARELSSYRL